MHPTTLTTRFWLKTLVFPAIALVSGCYLLSWNEERAVAKSRTLSEVAAGLVTISAESMHSVNDGKLVHMTGQLHASDTLKDPLFGVSGQFVKLQRDVEMYQWMQSVIERRHATPDGGTEVRKEFSYLRKWSPTLIVSSQFDQPVQYANPESIPYPAWNGEAAEVRVGIFRLSDSLIATYNEFSPVSVTESDLANVSSDLRDQVKVRDGKFYFSKDPANPQIGDVRVQFRGAVGATVSVIGKQAGETLGPYQTALGQAFESLVPGKRSAEMMFHQQAPTPANTWTLWLIRGLGFALLVSGCWAWMPHITPVGAKVQFLRVAFIGSWRVNAVIVAAMLWLLVVGAEWMNDRPFVAACAWLAAAALPASCILTRMNSESKKV